MQVLECHGMESESPLAFAGLHQLVFPLLGMLDDLPAPQSRALRVAFGEQEGPAVDPFVIALATLTMLTHAAETSAVVCIVDDAHWLDEATAAALLFVARRLQADPVVLIFAARDTDGHTFAADGVPSLQLSGLDEMSGRALLDEKFGGVLADDVAHTLLAQTGGNPLALVELPTALTTQQLAGSAPLPGQLHLTDRVQRVFLDRCRRLPEQVQTLLLVAAADDTGSLAVVRQAAAVLGVSAGAAEEAERAQLLVTDRDSIRVQHPLVRSAVYQSATGHDRRAAHRALATVLDGTHDPDRQAWHLAAAADGPDPDVASALERTATRAERAGGYAAAAAAFERAAELTTTGTHRAQLLFSAARNAWGSGQAARGRSHAEAARPLTDEPILRADIDRLRARIEVNIGSAATAHHIFTSAARAVAEHDAVRALEMRVAATLTQQFNVDVPEEIDAASAAGPLPTDVRTRCLQQLLPAMPADVSENGREAIAPMTHAVNLPLEVDDPDVVANVGNAPPPRGDDDGHRRCFTRMLA